jgi:hypothetical protein
MTSIIFNPSARRLSKQLLKHRVVTDIKELFYDADETMSFQIMDNDIEVQFFITCEMNPDRYTVMCEFIQPAITSPPISKPFLTTYPVIKIIEEYLQKARQNV